MGNILGTTVNLVNFFNKNKAVNIDLTDGKNSKTITILVNSRKYCVPKYQREIRWEPKQVKELIQDILDNSSFIGNIILKNNENDYEIIDGQQRITVLFMIFDYIQNHIFDREIIGEVELCPLIIESFTSFNIFRETKYGTDEEAYLKKECKIRDEDKYLQEGRYTTIWKCIEEQFQNDSDIMENFYKNAYKCEVNLIIIPSDENPRAAINHFIDVNQKGVKLDDEDILKGYLFNYSPNVEDIWVDIKHLCAKIENRRKGLFPLLALFEQYFYAVDVVRDMPDFKKDLTLSRKWGGIDSGTHIITALRNKVRIMNCLEEIKELAEIILELTADEASITPRFKKYFENADVEVAAKNYIFSLCRSCALTDNILPKIFLIKYIVSVLWGEPKDKEDYYSISTVYIYVTLFNLLSGVKKTRDHVYKFARGADWINNVSNLIKGFLSGNEFKFNSSRAFEHYYYAMIEDGENRRRDAYEFQALACIYNYLHKNGKGIICLEQKRNKKELFKLFSDKEAYSLEHFLLNDSGKYVYRTAEGKKAEGMYPESISKYIGGILNFIYIPETINGSILGNRLLPEKVDILTANGDIFNELSAEQKEKINQVKIACEYSNMILTMLQSKEKMMPKYFPGYWSAYESLNEKQITTYFKQNYAKDYLVFMDDVLTKVMQNLKNRVE